MNLLALLLVLDHLLEDLNLELDLERVELKLLLLVRVMLRLQLVDELKALKLNLLLKQRLNIIIAITNS